MSYTQFLAACLFAVVSLITPGPNNAMLLASGLNFGLRRTVPHWMGICLGFGFMQVLVGLGLHALLARHPQILIGMRYAGAAYLAWLAWKLARADTSLQDGPLRAAPLGFWGAAAFQWVNPKAWVMAMTAMSAYLPVDANLAQVLTLGAIFVVLGLPCVGCWAAFGSGMRRFLHNPRHLRIFNLSMALALVASLMPLFVH